MITKFIDCQPEDATHVRVFDDSGYPNFFPVDNNRIGLGGIENAFEFSEHRENITQFQKAWQS
jgi:hypothetical protein